MQKVAFCANVQNVTKTSFSDLLFIVCGDPLQVLSLLLLLLLLLLLRLLLLLLPLLLLLLLLLLPPLSVDGDDSYGFHQPKWRRGFFPPGENTLRAAAGVRDDRSGYFLVRIVGRLASSRRRNGRL